MIIVVVKIRVGSGDKMIVAVKVVVKAANPLFKQDGNLWEIKQLADNLMKGDKKRMEDVN